MFRLCVVLAVFGACAAKPEQLQSVVYNPPYAESSEAFSHAKLYLLENFPDKKINVSLAQDRQYHAFGIAAVVLSDEPSKNGSLSSFERLVPVAWEKYKTFAESAYNLAAEAQLRLSPLLKLINNECSLSKTLRECNIRVDAVVSKQPQLYVKRARLLFQLRKTAELLSELSGTVNSLNDNYELIPYLLRNLGNKRLNALSSSLRQSYKLLKELR